MAYTDINSFRDWFHENDIEEPGIFLYNPPLEAESAFNFLEEYLLPKNYYTTAIGSAKQINTVIVHDILYKHSRVYRLECEIEKLDCLLKEETNYLKMWFIDFKRKKLIKQLNKANEKR